MRRTSATSGWSFTLRAHLLALVIGTLLPALVLAAVLVRRVVDDNRDAIRRRLIEAARAEATVVDAELSGTVRALQALAQSDRLTRGEIPAFYDEAKRLQESRSTWYVVLLHDPDGRAILNTGRPLASALPAIADPETFDQVRAAGFDRHLVKPVATETLLEAIRAVSLV